MADEQQKIKDEYEEKLKAKEYVETLNAVWQEDPEPLKFMLTYITDVFVSGRFKGSKLLEIGSGATVHNVAAASAYFPNITMSDYVVDNVEHLKLWVEGKSDLVQFLDIPARLEGYGNDIETGRRVLESRIRKTIKRITRCDLLTDQVILDESNDPETSPPFDMIISCLCMEVAPKDYSAYCETLKRINKLLRKGGGLLMCGFLQGSKWKIGENAFHHVKLNEDEVLNALKNAGFDNADLQTSKGGKMKTSEFSYDKTFCVVAEKL